MSIGGPHLVHLNATWRPTNGLLNEYKVRHMRLASPVACLPALIVSTQAEEGGVDQWRGP